MLRSPFGVREETMAYNNDLPYSSGENAQIVIDSHSIVKETATEIWVDFGTGTIKLPKSEINVVILPQPNDFGVYGYIHMPKKLVRKHKIGKFWR